MLLPRFALHRPATLDEAVDLLGRLGEEATVYAGGTELLLAMKQRVLRYTHLVDIKHVCGLADVALTADGDLAVGALATHHRLEHHPLLQRHLPAYAAASRSVGNIRVRVAGTLGGNLCFAEPHADPPALLSALDAHVTLVGPAGTRELAVADFVVGPFETARQPDEVVSRVTIPVEAPRRCVAYERFGHLERPTAGVAAALDLSADGRTIRAARLWVGAVGPRPSALPTVAERLAGVHADALEDVLPAAARLGALAIPVDGDLHGSEDYKRHLVEVLVQRAVRRAAESRPRPAAT